MCGLCNVVGVCMCGLCNVWLCVCVGFVMCGCVCLCVSKYVCIKLRTSLKAVCHVMYLAKTGDVMLNGTRQ
jgi:hypothetical protein